MKKDEMNLKVEEELEHIPRWLRGSRQNELRGLYNMVRRRDLGREPLAPAYSSLLYCIDYLRQGDPSFIPKYDEDFFKKQ